MLFLSYCIESRLKTASWRGNAVINKIIGIYHVPTVKLIRVGLSLTAHISVNLQCLIALFSPLTSIYLFIYPSIVYLYYFIYVAVTSNAHKWVFVELIRPQNTTMPSQYLSLTLRHNQNYSKVISLHTCICLYLHI